ncbi:threonine synthase [Candidatus Altiarchaeota archaeon]
MSEPIQYYSTNRKAEKVSFREALLIGQAPDKGLYLPESIPRLEKELIYSLKGKEYPEVAFLVAQLFLKDELPDTELKKICEDAYNFPVPLEKVIGRQYLMRLDQGPTAAFKDFAARMMARLMQYFLLEEEGDGKLIILTATSGDTGGAVAAAFHGLDNIDVVVLFPEKEVSDRQRKQMTTLGENVTAIAVNGKFDDCQAMVKEAFTDKELGSIRLSSANSINFGRLLPQAVYYVYAYAQLFEEEGEEIVFSVPSGNFGDIMGGLVAKKIGVPVSKFVVAVNENDEFPRFVETGEYEKIVPSKNCPSTAMNVGHPSNLARLIDFYGGWLDERGMLHKMPDLDAIRKDMFAVSISNDDTRKVIQDTYEENNCILEPHGAVGWAGLLEYNKAIKDEPFAVSLETADPAKFPEVLDELGIKPDIPESLSRILEKEEEYDKLPANYSHFKEFLIKKFRD